VFTTFVLGLLLPWFLKLIKRSDSESDVKLHKEHAVGFKNLVAKVLYERFLVKRASRANINEEEEGSIVLPNTADSRSPLEEEFDNPSRILKFFLWVDRKFLAKCLIVPEAVKKIEQDRAKEYSGFVNLLKTPESD
jgi:hypothetical protein